MKHETRLAEQFASSFGVDVSVGSEKRSISSFQCKAYNTPTEYRPHLLLYVLVVWLDRCVSCSTGGDVLCAQVVNCDGAVDITVKRELNIVTLLISNFGCKCIFAGLLALVFAPDVSGLVSIGVFILILVFDLIRNCGTADILQVDVFVYSSWPRSRRQDKVKGISPKKIS